MVSWDVVGYFTIGVGSNNYCVIFSCENYILIMINHLLFQNNLWDCIKHLSKEFLWNVIEINILGGYFDGLMPLLTYVIRRKHIVQLTGFGGVPIPWLVSKTMAKMQGI